MCERCNPLGLRQPSAAQAHGTALLAVAGAIVVLAVLARLQVSGVGPYSSSLVGVAAVADGLRVTIALTNQGTSSSPTTCRVADPEIPGIGPETAFVQSPDVPAGGTITFDAVVRSLGTEARPLTVVCGNL
jgi:hypothetical protein